jgi:arachidonate 15-lipoxygenase
MVIWTAGPQHAAVNFTQEEHLGYLSANPIAGFTEEPRGRDHELEDWLANLPPLDVAVQQLCIMRFLGVIHETKLGEYDDDFKNTPVAPRAAWLPAGPVGHRGRDRPAQPPAAARL